MEDAIWAVGFDFERGELDIVYVLFVGVVV